MKWQTGKITKIGFYIIETKRSETQWLSSVFFRGDSVAVFDPTGESNLEIPLEDITINRWIGPIILEESIFTNDCCG